MDTSKNNVAIIGMTGIFPEATDLNEFSKNLSEKRDSVKEPKRERMTNCSINPEGDFKLAGHLDRIDYFDHLFFAISKKEAEFIEPTQRIILQMACEAIENAGYSLDSFKGSNTAVYIGANNVFPATYLQNINAIYNQKDPTIHTGTLSSMAFGRLAYSLQLTGPAVMVDTGCSSSLVAISEAMDKLLQGKIDYALVGAVNLKASFFEKNSGPGHLQAASPNGKSKAFSADADGIGIGEGGGMLLLKRLDKALEVNDNIHAVIKGIAVNQDGGRSNSITAPSPIAQTQVIMKAWENSCIDPETLKYVETHGAGTPLGDVIEFQSLTDAFNRHTEKRSFCGISAVKSNIGHLGNAAGMAGVIKAVLSLKNKVLFPSLHFNKPNQFIDFDNSAAFVNTELMQWEANDAYPRRCGVSSFGLSGTNSHLVLEEAPVKGKVADDENQECFLKISARSLSALSNYVKNIDKFLSNTHLNFSNALYTLNKGRGDYNYRIGINAQNKTELLQKLANLSKNSVEKLTPVKLKNKKAILLFPDQVFADGTIEKLSQKYQPVADIWIKIQELNEGKQLNSYQKAFAIQYGLYSQLISYGIPIAKFMGTGLGNYVTKVIKNSITLAEAVKLLSNYKPADSGFKEEVFKTTAKELVEKQEFVFVEIGKGIFSESIFTLKDEFKNIEIVNFLEDAQNSLLDSFTSIYNYGVVVDWEIHYKNRSYLKVEAPTYPFDKIRCWYDEPFKEVFDTLDEWFYEMDWLKTPQLPTLSEIKNETFLIFRDKAGLHKEIIDQLAPFNTCITVDFEDSYKEVSETAYQLNNSSKSDFVKLSQQLIENGVRLNGIFYLNNYTASYTLSTQNYQQHLAEQFLPFYYVLQGFDIQLKQPGFKLAVPTTNAYAISDTDINLIPINGMVVGLLKAVITEYTSLQLTSLDVSFNENSVLDVATILLKELEYSAPVRFAAIRNNNRYIPKLNKIKFDGKEIQKNFLLKENGIYIVTGGATGIGLETCKLLAENGKCTLIIIGRTKLDDNPENDRTLAIKLLEEAGAIVEYYCADVNDYNQMEEAILNIAEKYNQITGVFHSSGIGSSGVSIPNREIDDVYATLNPKFGGTIILEELTRYFNPQFFVLFSSIGTIVPSKNCADYTAANAFEDAFANKAHLNNQNFIAINWSDWKETGLQFRKNIFRSKEEIASREKVIQGITNREGMAAIKSALSLKKPQLAVAKADLSSFKVNPFFVLDDSIFNISGNNATEVSINDGKICKAPCNNACAAAIVVKKPAITKNQEFTETEAKVIEIWYEVLKLENINLDDDFYEIGGHSLNIMQMLNLIKKAFSIEVGLEEMLYNSTIKKLAQRIDDLLTGGAAKHEAIQAVPAADFFEISHAQKRFWILNMLDGKEAYNVPLAFIFKGPLKADLLQNAFASLIERHESLRTGFILVNGKPMQKIHDASSLNFKIKTLDITKDPDADGLARQIVEAEAGIPFDLSMPPLIRALLIKIDHDKHIFCFTMHHVVTDARSIAIIKKEILEFYKAFNTGILLTLPKLLIQYKDFVAWQNSQLSGEKLENHKRYWFERLDGSIKPIQFPVDFNTPEVQSSEAGRVGFALEKESIKQLRKLAERNSTTIFIVSLAIFKVLISKFAQTNDIIVGTPVSGRGHDDLNNQVGIYLNTLLLRTLVDETETFNSLLKSIKHNVNKDFEHQVYPYDLLAEQIQNNQQSQASLFNLGFTWNVKGDLEDDILDIDLTIEDFPTGFVKAKTDLWLLVSETTAGVDCTFVFKTALFKKESIEILKDRFLTLIQQVITGYDKKIADLHIKLPSEQLLEEPKLNVNFSF